VSVKNSVLDTENGFLLQNWLDRRVPGLRIPVKGNCYGTEGIGIVYTHLREQRGCGEASE
jgi:hypothetical protein